MNTRQHWNLKHDGKLFRKGFRHTFEVGSVGLPREAATATGAETPSTEQVLELLYDKRRCALNHSKEGQKEKKLMPFNPKDETEVAKTLPLMRSVARQMIDKTME